MSTDKDLLAQLKEFGTLRTVILGIGNTLKGDDGLGPAVCAELKGKVTADVIDTGTVPENYIGPVIKKAPELLLVVDAVDFGAPPGTIRILTPQALSSLALSTHAPSPRLFVDMLRKEIPVDVYFIGIQPARTDLGRSLSPKVAQAVKSLADVLARIFPKAGTEQN